MTVTGGKWTTYRRMAQETVDVAVETAVLDVRDCVTETLRLHGFDPSATAAAGLPDARRMYGTDRVALDALEQQDPQLATPLHAALSITGSEVVFAVRSEMARTVDDVLARRTRSLLLDARAAIAISDRVAQIMATELGWSPQQADASATAFREIARGYLPA